jgi:methionine-rich copper-binding protein CopC
MNAGRRLLAATMLLGFALACTVTTAGAVDHPTVAKLRQTPKVFMVSPATVNLKVQPNIVLIGQNLATSTRVVIGGRAATTIDAPDTNHLMVQVPADLEDGTYILQASNGDLSSTADEMLTVKAGTTIDQKSMLIVVGAIVLLLLAARLAHFQTF